MASKQPIILTDKIVSPPALVPAGLEARQPPNPVSLVFAQSQPDDDSHLV